MRPVKTISRFKIQQLIPTSHNTIKAVIIATDKLAITLKKSFVNNIKPHTPKKNWINLPWRINVDGSTG